MARYLNIMGRLTILALVLLVMMLPAAGCGRFAKPRPPEDFSPAEVKNLQAAADLQGVKLLWSAPENDLRSKPLKQIDGYRVYRKPITNNWDIMDEDIPYELIATVLDTHLQVLDEMKKKAEEEGKPTRRLKSDSALTEFEYTDAAVQAGHSYVYQIIPFNQGDVEGNTTQMVRVTFRGDRSEVNMVPLASKTEETF